MATKRKKMLRKASPRKSGDIPATAAMLNEARHEVKSEITSFRLEVDAQFKQVDARFEQVNARFEQVNASIAEVRAEVAQVKSEVSEVKSEVHKVLAAVHRVGLLVEEQNARNKFVLDGYTSLSDRMDKIEKKSGHDL